MAKELITRLRDDFDRTLGEDVETYPFAWRGTAYEIELNTANVARMDQAMAPFIAVARKAIPPRKRKQKAETVVALPLTNGQRAKQLEQRARLADALAQRRRIRDWANHHGFTVGPKGVIPAVAIEAYEKARENCRHLRTYSDGERAGQCTKCHEVVE